MYAQLGDIVFEALIGFDSYQRSVAATYAEHALMNRKPRKQRTGTELQKISATIAFHDVFCTPEDEIKKFEDYLNEGDVLPLLFGNGRYIGDFVVMDISEQILQTYSDGTYKHARLTINLEEVSSAEKDVRAAEKKQRDAAALQGNRPATVRGQPRGYEDAASNMAKNISETSSQVSKIGGIANSLDLFKAANAAILIADSAKVIIDHVSNIQGSLLDDPLLASLSPDLFISSGVVSNAAANIMGINPIVTIDSIKTSNDLLQDAMKAMKTAAAGVLAKTILRK